jgi:MFS transporter, OFA family, oxalate/formate antiporter
MATSSRPQSRHQSQSEPESGSFIARPWTQLIVGMLCMVMIANLQYGWTLFVGPIGDKYHWTKASIQITFSVFVVFQTWLVPAQGYLVDRFGPRWMIVAGGLLGGTAWVLNSFATSLQAFYVAAALGGLGAGAVYGTCIGNAVKWFPGRRGLAAGLTAAGFGMGSALTVIPIANMIKTAGYEQAFLTFGVLQGIGVVVVGMLIMAPTKDFIAAAPKLAPGALRYQTAPLAMLKTPVFWVMYLMFVMMAAGGLMATAQLAPIAKDLHVDKVPVSMVGLLTLPALQFALSLNTILNGLSRPFFGWVSDKIGREVTMFMAFLAEGLAVLALANFGTDPVSFVVLTGLVFFAWGEIYSLFPATVTDTFGAHYATTNAGLMYTAKGTAALLVPLASVAVGNSGNWHGVFVIAAALNMMAAVAALVILKPLRTAFANRFTTVGTAKLA